MRAKVRVASRRCADIRVPTTAARDRAPGGNVTGSTRQRRAAAAEHQVMLRSRFTGVGASSPSGVADMRLQREIVTPFADRSIVRAPRGRAATLFLCLALTLAGCGGNGGGSVNIANSQGPDPGTVDFPIFYVKRTIPMTASGTVAQDDLRMMRVTSPSADLYMRSAASPEAPETNITARITAGATYDVKDVDVSPDGTKVAFAMRGPVTANMDPAKAPSWRIYEYTIATNTLAPMIDPTADTAPDTINDVSPHYLPDGSIVF